MKDLIKTLNEARDAYYNRNSPIMSDKEYDKLFDELAELEKFTGIIYPNSPTQTVGYEVVSSLKKVKHNHPMLSLDKTKSITDLIKFIGDHSAVFMQKLDGLTCSLKYEDGVLVSAETRGNGEIGEDILHNARVISNIPQRIKHKGTLVVDGEIIINKCDFERINANLPADQQYKNPRNLASGSVRQLDSKIASSRYMEFIAWRCVEGIDDNNFMNRLYALSSLGFDIVDNELYNYKIWESPYYDKVVLKGRLKNTGESFHKAKIAEVIKRLKNKAIKRGIPIDGIVIGYNDVKYGESLGVTSHHPKNQIAYKFADDTEETVIKDVEWTMGKTGTLTPVAIFEPVEIDGTIVEKASLYNIAYLREKDLSYGDTIAVIKANQIIPRVEDNISHNGDAPIIIPKKCPVCGQLTKIVSDVLTCTNPECKGKLLNKLIHFCSREALDIRGLSEETIRKFIENGYLSCFADVFNLKQYKSEIMNLPGFGRQSTQKLLASIEKAKTTTLDRYIYSLSIPLIGKSASKVISNEFDGDPNKYWEAVNGKYPWTKLQDFGETMSRSIQRHYSSPETVEAERALLFSTLTIENEERQTSDRFRGKIFVITGKVYKFKNRNALKEFIETNGGKVAGSISKNTSYLINNDVNSTSGKNKKAKELGVKIISEETLLEI